MINASWPVAGTHTALSITPAAGFNRDRASTNASSDNASTDCTHPRASHRAGLGHQSATTRRRRRRRRAAAAWHADPARPAAPPPRRPRLTPAGACTTMVWLNCSTGPSTPCSQRMIGVATTGPMPSSTHRRVVAGHPGHPGQPGHRLLDEDVAGPAQRPRPPGPGPPPASTECCRRPGRRTSRRPRPARRPAPGRRCRPGSPRPRWPGRGTHRRRCIRVRAGRACRVCRWPSTAAPSSTTTAAGTM